jgi:Putative peptidoglycan binding domain
MKKFNVFHWLAAVAVVAALPSRREAHLVTLWETTQERSLIFLVNPDSVIRLTPGGRDHDFAFRHDDGGRFRGRGFDRNDRFFHRHRFFTDFRFFGFGYPYDWYPEHYYYGYPYNYSYYDFGPVYDHRYSCDLAMMVQAELAGRGYYRGPINGVIGSGSRRAIREFQAAEGLPITGRIDESLIRALRTGELSAPPEDTSIKPLPSPTPAPPRA